MIRNVFLDLDDTLLDFHRAEREALGRTFLALGLEAGEELLDHYSRINQACWRQLERGELSREELKLQRFVRLFREEALPGAPEQAAGLYELQLSRGHYFMPGAPELLAALRGRYRLFLASNGTTPVQRGRIASAGIAPYFEEIFLSEELGSNKPDPAFFDACFRARPDLRRSECILVGDSLSSDIQGGINAGIATVWYNPRGLENPTPRPEREIRSLAELPALLECWEEIPPKRAHS